MPIMERSTGQLTITAAASAPLELMWVLHNSQAKHVLDGSYASMEPVRARYGTALREFWNDGVRDYTEAMVLAQWGGTLLDLDLDRYFATLDAVAARGGDAGTLLSEAPSHRAALIARLERLRTEPELRSKYRSLLMEVWEPLSTEWAGTGCATAVAEAEAWRRRLESGEEFRAILERPRIWAGRPEMDDLANAAAAEGRLILSPGWFFGEIHVVEIDGNLYLGRGIRAADNDALRRATSIRVAGNLKALADPTRLNIVLLLACQPSSVTEVAKCLELS